MARDNATDDWKVQLVGKSRELQVLTTWALAMEILGKRIRNVSYSTFFLIDDCPQCLANIDANLLNGIVPIAEPIPLGRLGLYSACHIRRTGGNHRGTRLLKASDKLPPLPAMSPWFAHQA